MSLRACLSASPVPLFVVGLNPCELFPEIDPLGQFLQLIPWASSPSLEIRRGCPRLAAFRGLLGHISSSARRQSLKTAYAAELNVKQESDGSHRGHRRGRACA